MTFETFDQSDEETWPDQKKDKDKDKEKRTMIDLWHLRHWLHLRQLRTWIHDNLCYLTINCDTGQHSQFLRCLWTSMNFTDISMSFHDLHTLSRNVCKLFLKSGKWTPPIFSAFIIFMISMFQTKYEKSSEVKTFDKCRYFEIRMSLMALIFSNMSCLKVLLYFSPIFLA